MSQQSGKKLLMVSEVMFWLDCSSLVIYKKTNILDIRAFGI